MNLSPLWITLKIASASSVIAFFLSLYTARFVYRITKFKGLIDGILTIPMVLPPTVVGFYLLITFGKNGFIGKILSTLNISIIFTVTGAILASVVVAFPLGYRTFRSAFEQFDTTQVDVARSLGLSESRIFWSVILPNNIPSAIGAIVLIFARSMGEFGATIMLAGNLPGRTQTISTAIYTAIQAGNRQLAGRWSIIVVTISLTCVVMMNLFNKSRS
jgi:molybdate transport system permease protein